MLNDKWALENALWAMLRKTYGDDLKSVFIVVTTISGTVLKQNSFMVYPPDGEALPNDGLGR
jgi:hypothetical protein